MGASDKLPDDAPDITQLYVDDLHALIDHLGATRLGLVGFASTGHVVLRYAAQHPEHLAQIVTLNASPRFRRGPQLAASEALLHPRFHLLREAAP